MQLDTGASVSVIDESTYHKIQKQSYVLPLQPAKNVLKTYTDQHIQVLGITQMKAKYGESEWFLPIHVVSEGGPNLMGRDWISKFEVNLKHGA